MHEHEFSVAERQLRAIDAFNQARRTAEQAMAVAARTRETRMDAARRLEVLRREHDALIARAHEQLRRSGAVLMSGSIVRAVVAHRQPWFSERVADLLERSGVELVARTGNGADAIGVAVAEQPDLLVVEDALVMVSGEEVVREVRRYCRTSVIAVQVAHSDRVGVMLEAGASTVNTRQVPPGDLVSGALALLGR